MRGAFVWAAISGVLAAGCALETAPEDERDAEDVPAVAAEALAGGGIGDSPPICSSGVPPANVTYTIKWIAPGQPVSAINKVDVDSGGTGYASQSPYRWTVEIKGLQPMGDGGLELHIDAIEAISSKAPCENSFVTYDVYGYLPGYNCWKKDHTVTLQGYWVGGCGFGTGGAEWLEAGYGYNRVRVASRAYTKAMLGQFAFEIPLAVSFYAVAFVLP
jgi:hypothetical protein